jgi:hypothetical protein
VTPRVEALIVEMEEEPDAESADAFCHLARALERENAQLREALEHIKSLNQATYTDTKKSLIEDRNDAYHTARAALEAK